jgi:hypothetical protein
MGISSARRKRVSSLLGGAAPRASNFLSLRNIPEIQILLRHEARATPNLLTLHVIPTPYTLNEHSKPAMPKLSVFPSHPHLIATPNIDAGVPRS